MRGSGRGFLELITSEPRLAQAPAVHGCRDRRCSSYAEWGRQEVNRMITWRMSAGSQERMEVDFWVQEVMLTPSSLDVGSEGEGI